METILSIPKYIALMFHTGNRSGLSSQRYTVDEHLLVHLLGLCKIENYQNQKIEKIYLFANGGHGRLSFDEKKKTNQLDL